MSVVRIDADPVDVEMDFAEFDEVEMDTLGAAGLFVSEKSVTGTVTVDAGIVVADTTDAENAGAGPISTDEDPMSYI